MTRRLGAGRAPGLDGGGVGLGLELGVAAPSWWRSCRGRDLDWRPDCLVAVPGEQEDQADDDAETTTTTMTPLRICLRCLWRLASASSRASRAARWRALLSLGTARDHIQSPGWPLGSPPATTGPLRPTRGRDGPGARGPVPGSGPVAQSVASSDAPGRPEIRWHLGRRRGPHPRRGRPHRADPPPGVRRGRRRERHGQDDRRADPPGELGEQRPSRPGSTTCS